MTTWILVLFVTIGGFSTKDSMALTNVPGFQVQSECESAGKASVNKFGTGTKRAEYICIAQTNK